MVFREFFAFPGFPSEVSTPLKPASPCRDLTLLQNLTNQREVVIDQLEESESRYIACFEPVNGDSSDVPIPSSSHGPRSKKSSTSVSSPSRSDPLLHPLTQE